MSDASDPTPAARLLALAAGDVLSATDLGFPLELPDDKICLQVAARCVCLGTPRHERGHGAVPHRCACGGEWWGRLGFNTFETVAFPPLWTAHPRPETILRCVAIGAAAGPFPELEP
jgi:hypothetical protein